MSAGAASSALSADASQAFARYQAIQACDEENYLDSSKQECKAEAALDVVDKLRTLPENDAGALLTKMGMQGLGVVSRALVSRPEHKLTMDLVRYMEDGVSLPVLTTKKTSGDAIATAYRLAVATGQPLHFEWIAQHMSASWESATAAARMDPEHCAAFVMSLPSSQREAVIKDMLHAPGQSQRNEAIWASYGTKAPEEAQQALAKIDDHVDLQPLANASAEWPPDLRDAFMMKYAGVQLAHDTYGALKFAAWLERHLANENPERALESLMKLATTNAGQTHKSLPMAILAGSLSKPENVALLKTVVKATRGPEDVAEYELLVDRYKLADTAGRLSRAAEKWGLVLSEESTGGFLVSSVIKGSPAALMRIHAGDHINSVNKDVSNFYGLRNEMFFNKSDESPPLEVDYVCNKPGALPGRTIVTLPSPDDLP